MWEGLWSTVPRLKLNWRLGYQSKIWQVQFTEFLLEIDLFTRILVEMFGASHSQGARSSHKIHWLILKLATCWCKYTIASFILTLCNDGAVCHDGFSLFTVPIRSYKLVLYIFCNYIEHWAETFLKAMQQVMPTCGINSMMEWPDPGRHQFWQREGWLLRYWVI